MTNHYEERLEHDLGRIRGVIKEIAGSVEKALGDAIHAILIGDRALSSHTILGDLPINRRVRELDRMCHGFVAQHLPSAGHLRFVSSVLRLSIALERIGDYAVTLSREQVQLSQPPSHTVSRDIELLGEQSVAMFKQAMSAFHQGNADLALGTKAMADQVEGTFQRVFQDLLREGEKGTRPIKDLFATLVILNRIGRVADQSKNICEETVFTATGQTKEPKVYRVLFIDERNASLSQMAALYAQRAFPESGRFSSAGWSPAAKLDTRFEIFMRERGFDLQGAHPTDLATLRDEVDDTHVVISLGGSPWEHFEELPFHTALLEWDVGVDPASFDQERAEAVFDEALKRLKGEIGSLMETLRGEGAH